MENKRVKKEKKKKIGGSHQNGILGEETDQYSTAISVWLDLTSGPESKETEPTYWGKDLEANVKRRFKKENKNLKVYSIKTQKELGLRSLTHPTLPFLGGSPDACCEDENGVQHIIEIKTTNEFCKDDWESGVPKKHYAQVQWYMGLTGFPKAYVACLVGGNKYFQYEVPFCKEFYDEAVKKSVGFWYGYVDTGIQPPPTNKDLDKRLLGQEIVRLDKPETLRTNYINDSIDNYLKSKDVDKENKGNTALAYNQIQSECDGHQSVESDKYKIKVMKVTLNRVDTEKLKKEYPEAYEATLKESTYSKVKIKEKKL